MKILYQCDGLGCEKARDVGKCPSTECNLTSDISHAINFVGVTEHDGEDYYFEKYRSETNVKDSTN